MQYRLTDPYLDPTTSASQSAQSSSYYSEHSVYLRRSYWCYRPNEKHEGPPSQTPASRSGAITFGCLATPWKVNHAVLSAAAEVLGRVRNSRLVLIAMEGSPRRRIGEFFARRGIALDRLIFHPLLPLQEYFDAYRDIDIALDTFPGAGGTTTCDALWAGTPLVTLAGMSATQRGGVSILTNLDLPELVASSPQVYVSLAAELANDPPRLQSLRRSLRDRMRASPLMDEQGFACDIESAYRTMWREWCSAPSAA